MTPAQQKERDELAKEQGNRHANPVIRSMYPSKSRGEMAREFAQLYSLGFDAAHALVQKEVLAQQKPVDELLDVMENLYEYWNGGDESAVDACQHTVDETLTMLQKYRWKESEIVVSA